MKAALFTALMLAAPLMAAASGHAGHMGMNTPVQPQKLSPMHQAYAESMQTMHEGMMQGIAAQNPDAAFAAGMLAHHQGAVEMAQIELEYGKDPVMRKLAENIIQAQEGEIKLMQNWLAGHSQR